MSEIIIENHGPAVVASNYWESERDGRPFASVHAGAIRILLPGAQLFTIDQVRQSRHAVVSIGPWVGGGEAGIEILFESRTSVPPPVMILSRDQFDQLPPEPKPGNEYILALWIEKKGKPHKALERICFWRRVEKLPCLLPWHHEVKESDDEDLSCVRGPEDHRPVDPVR